MRRYLKRTWILVALLFFVCAYTTLTYKYHVVWTARHTTNQVTESAVASLQSYKHVTKSLAELGKTPELSAHILFFNRVPKSGSEMLVLLLQWLQGTNNFRHIRLPGGKKRQLSRLEQEQLVDEVTNIIKNKAVPLSFDRHMYFLNFTSFDKQSPTYINLVRDPVEKLISRFYYKRITPNPNNPDLKYAPAYGLDEKYAQESFEECMHNQQKECTFKDGYPYDLTIPYFCGQHPRCMLFNDKWALAIAKSNVERYYPVVGVLEELNTTLEMFENVLPYFFKGIQNVYFKDLFQPHQNKNRMRPQVNDDIKRHFKKLFVCEYEFYEWIKTRLFEQLQMLYGHAH